MEEGDLHEQREHEQELDDTLYKIGKMYRKDWQRSRKGAQRT